MTTSDNLFPVLSKSCVLRKLEAPFVYNIEDDLLYELDEEAFEFLKKCDGRTNFSNILEDQESVEYMVKEGILHLQETPHTRKINIEQSPIPSLRYLLLNITNKCNLKCKHCYSKHGNKEMSINTFEKAVSQFSEMGGLKLMVTGGEPLMHSGFWQLILNSACFK